MGRVGHASSVDDELVNDICKDKPVLSSKLSYITRSNRQRYLASCITNELFPFPLAPQIIHTPLLAGRPMEASHGPENS